MADSGGYGSEWLRHGGSSGSRHSAQARPSGGTKGLMTNQSLWYAAQAKANPDLFRVVYDFNRRPQSWVHASVLDALPHAAVVKALAATTNYGAGHVAT